MTLTDAAVRTLSCGARSRLTSSSSPPTKLRATSPALCKLPIGFNKKNEWTDESVVILWSAAKTPRWQKRHRPELAATGVSEATRTDEQRRGPPVVPGFLGYRSNWPWWQRRLTTDPDGCPIRTRPNVSERLGCPELPNSLHRFPGSITCSLSAAEPGTITTTSG